MIHATLCSPQTMYLLSQKKFLLVHVENLAWTWEAQAAEGKLSRMAMGKWFFAMYLCF